MFTLTSLFAFVAGAVVTVVFPKVFTWVKKQITSVENKVDPVKPVVTPTVTPAA